MRIIKKVLCILVIFALAVSFVPTSASAAGLAVVGTSFSSVGMTSAEFAASAGPYAIGILAAVAAAYGIKAFTQTETGQAVKDFFQGLIEKRAAAMRRSVSEQMEVLLGNATIDEDGNINLGRHSFAEAKETLLQDNIPTSKPMYTRYLKDYAFAYSLNYTFTFASMNVIYYIDSKTSMYNYMFFQQPRDVAGSRHISFIVPVSGTHSIYMDNASTGETVQLYYDVSGPEFLIGSRRYMIVGVKTPYPSNAGVPVYNRNDILSGTYTQDDLRIVYPPDTLYGVDETLRDQTVNLNEGLTLAPDLINSAVIGGASGQITARDYCGALVDYVSGYDTVIDGVTVTGLPEVGTVPRSIDDAPTSDTVIDEAPPSTMTGTEAAGLYSFALDELFPFCLPFDFVHLIEKFNVEPEAPNFDWRFCIPGVIDYTLHIDLSAWDSVAAVFRNMVLVAFVIGLIILTREIFIRA